MSRPADAAHPAELVTLARECERYLAARAGQGIATVRREIGTASRGTPARRPGQPNPVVTRYLDRALAALLGDDPPLAGAIAAAAPLLRWLTYDAYGADIGPDFPKSHAYASLVGGADAPFPARPDFNFGLFIIAPGTLYRDHRHAAPELYAPLTGPHFWRFTPGVRFRARAAHVPVWNRANRPHATLSGDVPFLALYAWTRDLTSRAVVLPADDWARYEGAGRRDRSR